jgi:hypothetical protein
MVPFQGIRERQDAMPRVKQSQGRITLVTGQRKRLPPSPKRLWRTEESWEKLPVRAPQPDNCQLQIIAKYVSALLTTGYGYAKCRIFHCFFGADFLENFKNELRIFPGLSN